MAVLETPSGRAGGTPAAEGSTKDPKFRQCCLEFLYPRVRDLGAAEGKPLQALKVLQFLQPRVRDLRAVKVQFLQALEVLQFLQARVRDLHAVKVQYLQVFEFLQL